MKKDVSCRIMLSLLNWGEKRNLPPNILCAGLNYPLSFLRNKHERVEWSDFLGVMANLRPHLSDDQFVEIGREIVLTEQHFTGASVIGRLLFTGTEFYLWFNRGIDGPGVQLFACITPSVKQVDKNRLIVTLQLFPNYEHSREFFLITCGSLEMASTYMGLKPATVEMHEIEHGAVYDIECPEGGGALSWLRKAVTWPFAARSAARQLKEANEVLHERYGQLEEAQAEIQRQATQLRTAFSISENIRRNLDLDATVEAVTQSLVKEGHFASAKVEICAKTDVGEIRRLALKGVVASDTQILNRTLEARGQNLGTISVSLHPASDLSEAQELLDQVAPSIAMEISDALSFTLLTEYRNRDRTRQQEFSHQQIESQEAERKRLAAVLHDGLGQDLLVANNELQQFMQENKESREELKQVASLVQESIEGVREISANLHPHHLERLGLRAAIEAMVEKVSRSSGLNVRVAGDTIDRLLPKETEIHLYRIIQEALSNVAQHASAKSAEVAVKKNAGSIEITVSDDGKGFDPNGTTERKPAGSSVERFRGFGLSSMTERVRIIGGAMKIASTPGSGTIVQVSLPYS